MWSGRLSMPLQKQMVKCFSQVLTFAQILAYSQFHKFLPMITNHRGWWMVRGVIGASSCPTKPSTAVNQLQPKSCRKPPKRTTPYHVVHFITGTTCVIPWQPGANHGNLVTAIIPALLWQVYCRRWNPLGSCTWQLALPWTTQKKATPFFSSPTQFITQLIPERSWCCFIVFECWEW